MILSFPLKTICKVYSSSLPGSLRQLEQWLLEFREAAGQTSPTKDSEVDTQSSAITFKTPIFVICNKFVDIIEINGKNEKKIDSQLGHAIDNSQRCNLSCKATYRNDSHDTIDKTSIELDSEQHNNYDERDRLLEGKLCLPANR
jgi:hypothetical protein